MTPPGWLESRKLQPEVMDDPGLDPREHLQALRALRRINLLSASVSIVWPPLRKLAREQQGRRLRVLDIATGSGDLPRALVGKAQRAGLDLEVLGVDVSPRAIEAARLRTPVGSPDLRFEQLDALREPLPEGYDVVMCSLFLHHLTDDEARHLIQKMASVARRMVVISDLRRSRYGWWLAYAASRLLTRSKVVHVDALLSVQAAFTMSELQNLAAGSGLSDVQVVPRWPCRMLLTGRTEK